MNPVILVGNTHTKGKGLYRSETTEFVVQVYRLKGRMTYDYTLNNVPYGMHCCEVEIAWAELARTLCADIVIVDKKWLNKEIKILEKEDKGEEF